MGKDAVRIFIQNIDLNTLDFNNTSQWTSKKKTHWKPTSSSINSSQYKHRQQRYPYCTLVTDSGCIHVEYMRYSQSMGDLLLTLSVAELYMGNNSFQMYVIDVDDLIHRIKLELRFVLDISLLPPPNTWMISRDETNFDIVDTVTNTKIRFDLIKKLNLPRMKIDLTHADKGTIYFHSGKARKDAGVIIIVYIKSYQQDLKGNDLHKILRLLPNQDVLRVEIKTKGNSLKSRIHKASNKHGFSTQESKLRTAVSKEYQISQINELIALFGFDKIITTRSNLIRIIESSMLFSKARLKTCKRVIRFLNGETKTISLSDKSISIYKKMILSTGYHFLYSCEAILPLILNNTTGRIEDSGSYVNN
jgi:hypothetical protein